MPFSFDQANAVIHEGPDSGGLYNGAAVSFAVDADGAEALFLFICGLSDGGLDLTGASIVYDPGGTDQVFTEIALHECLQSPGGNTWCGYILAPTAGSNNVSFTIAAGSGDVNSYVAFAIPANGLNGGTPIIVAQGAGGPDSTGTISGATYSPTAGKAGDVAVLVIGSRDALDGNVRPILEGTDDVELFNGVSGAVNSTGPDGYCAVSDSTTPNSTSDCTLWIAYEEAADAGTVTVQGTLGETERASWAGFLINAAESGSSEPGTPDSNESATEVESAGATASLGGTPQDVESASEVGTAAASVVLTGVAQAPESLTQVEKAVATALRPRQARPLNVASEVGTALASSILGGTAQAVESATEVGVATSALVRAAAVQAVESATEVAIASTTLIATALAQAVESAAEVVRAGASIAGQATPQPPQSATEVARANATLAGQTVAQALNIASEVALASRTASFVVSAQSVESATEVEGAAASSAGTVSVFSNEVASEVSRAGATALLGAIAAAVEIATEVAIPEGTVINLGDGVLVKIVTLSGKIGGKTGQHFVIQAGTDTKLDIYVIKANGTPENLTNVVFRGQFMKHRTDDVSIDKLAGDFTIEDAAAGHISLLLTDEDTADLLGRYAYEIEGTDSQGNKNAIIRNSKMRVDPNRGD